MIDDITLRGYVPQGEPIDIPPERWVHGKVKRDAVVDERNGHKVTAYRVHQGFVALTIVQSLRVVICRLSVPRMAGSFYNFPLLSMSDGVGSLDLDTPEHFIRRATGWSPSPGLAGWGVESVAYAIDVFVGVGNVTPTLEALAAVRRAHNAKSNEFRDRSKVLTGVQFGGDGYRVMAYDKHAELEGRIPRVSQKQEPFGRGGVDERRALAEQARGYVRFEVTLRGSEEVRDPFGIPTHYLPTLRIMARPSTARYIISEELRALRLDQIAVEAEAEPDDAGAEDLLVEVERRATAFNKRPGQVRKINRMRMVTMAGYQLLLATVPRPRLVELLGGGESSLFALEKLLRDIGMPPMGVTSAGPHRRLRAFTDAIRGQLGELSTAAPQLGEEPCAEGLVTDAPKDELAMDYEHIGRPDIGIVDHDSTFDADPDING